jgi:cobalamin biosynthesis protein CobD/CbiB
MKLKIKKYIYLLNDITNSLLKKDREQTAEHLRRLRNLFFVVVIILVISIILNLYLLLK